MKNPIWTTVVEVMKNINDAIIKLFEIVNTFNDKFVPLKKVIKYIRDNYNAHMTVKMSKPL